MTDSLDDKTDEFFVGYCIMHGETPRALFRGDHISRLLRIAIETGVDVSEYRDPDHIPQEDFFAFHNATSIGKSIQKQMRGQ